MLKDNDYKVTLGMIGTSLFSGCDLQKEITNKIVIEPSKLNSIINELTQEPSYQLLRVIKGLSIMPELLKNISTKKVKDYVLELDNQFGIPKLQTCLDDVKNLIE